MRCLVVGAGLLGLTTAWFLRQRGADVCVCERRAEVGLETSFANGGMLHASQASPWNEPGVLWQALKTLGREDSALLMRMHALPRMLPWAWSFFRHSTQSSYLTSLEKNTRLADYSLSVLNEHIAPLALDFNRADLGTLKVYRTARELESAAMVAERCRDWNVRYDVLDRSGVSTLEPALEPIQDALTGGIHFPGDVSGDAYLFCCELARRCVETGVTFDFGATVERIVVRNDQVHAVQIDGEARPVDVCVVAAGSYSPGLCKRIGVRIPVQPVKGYSITVPADSWPRVPRVPVIDEHFHAAVCPLGHQVRVAGTAEFAGFDARLRATRIENLHRLIAQIYPDGARSFERSAALEWTGFRPMSPDGVGVMGPTSVDGLYLNTGHGHLGWTMAPGAGKLVADAIVGDRGEIALEDYALARFAR